MRKRARSGKFGKKWKKIWVGRFAASASRLCCSRAGRAARVARDIAFADLGGLAVALLELLTAAAGAGIIASHFGAGADRLRCLSLGGAGLILKLLLLALLFALDFFGLVFGARGLNQEKIADSFCVDA